MVEFRWQRVALAPSWGLMFMPVSIAGTFQSLLPNTISSGVGSELRTQISPQQATQSYCIYCLYHDFWREDTVLLLKASWSELRCTVTPSL